MNNSFPISPNTQHHLPWRQYGLCNRFWSFSGLRPRSFSHIIVVRDPLFIARNHSFRFSSNSQMETLSIKFFTVNSCETQVSSFFWHPVLCKWFEIVLWSMFSSVAMSRDEICRSTSNFIDFFNDWPARARFICNIQISGTKTSKPTLTLAFT